MRSAPTAARRRGWLAAAALLVAAGCTGKYIRETTPEVVQATPERLARGKYLVDNVAMCAACHDGRKDGDVLQQAEPELRLAGGNVIVEREFQIYIPNITSDAETGVGRWSDDELIRAIRDGVKPDGSFMFPMMPYPSYQHMSDVDARAIVAYMRSVPKVKQTRPRVELDLPFPIGLVLGMGVMMHEPAKNVPEPDRKDPVKYGEYLAYMGDCTTCHNFEGMGVRDRDDRWMAGSEKPMDVVGVGKVAPANLTPHPTAGLGKYSADQIKVALQSGTRLDGKLMAPPMSLFTPYLALMEPADLDALVAYLRSLPPVDMKVPPRELEPKWKELLRD